MSCTRVDEKKRPWKSINFSFPTTSHLSLGFYKQINGPRTHKCLSEVFEKEQDIFYPLPQQGLTESVLIWKVSFLPLLYSYTFSNTWRGIIFLFPLKYSSLRDKSVWRCSAQHSCDCFSNASLYFWLKLSIFIIQSCCIRNHLIDLLKMQIILKKIIWH